MTVGSQNLCAKRDIMKYRLTHVALAYTTRSISQVLRQGWRSAHKVILLYVYKKKKKILACLCFLKPVTTVLGKSKPRMQGW